MSDSEDLLFKPQVYGLKVHQSNVIFPVHRIFCIGHNFHKHAQELGRDKASPFIFLKPASALVSAATNKATHWDMPHMSDNVQPETEMIIAIGPHRGERKGRSWDVFGYGIGLDVTLRDKQFYLEERRLPWCACKGVDRAAVVSEICQTDKTPEGIIESTVNDEPRQQANLSAEMIWHTGEILTEIEKQGWELQPGDIIFTGSPAGCGAVHHGDVIRAQVEGLPVTLSVVVD